MERRVVAALVAAGLIVGLVAGLALGGDGGTSEALAVGPGPNRVVNGVPVGYAQTREGAVAAASNYTAALASVVGAEAREKALRVATVPEQRGRILGDRPEALATIDGAFGKPGTFLRSGVLGQQVLAYTPERAEVELWGSTVTVPAPPALAQVGASVFRAEVRWHDGDWKLWSMSSRSAEIPGPSSERFLAAVQDLKGVWYAPAG